MAYRKDKVDASAIRHKDGYADNLMNVEVYNFLGMKKPGMNDTGTH